MGKQDKGEESAEAANDIVWLGEDVDASKLGPVGQSINAYIKQLPVQVIARHRKGIKVERRDGTIEEVDSARLLAGLIKAEGIAAEVAPGQGRCLDCGERLKLASASRCAKCYMRSRRVDDPCPLCACGQRLSTQPAAITRRRKGKGLRCRECAGVSKKQDTLAMCSCGKALPSGRGANSKRRRGLGLLCKGCASKARGARDRIPSPPAICGCGAKLPDHATARKYRRNGIGLKCHKCGANRLPDPKATCACGKALPDTSSARARRRKGKGLRCLSCYWLSRSNRAGDANA